MSPCSDNDAVVGCHDVGLSPCSFCCGDEVRGGCDAMLGPAVADIVRPVVIDVRNAR